MRWSDPARARRPAGLTLLEVVVSIAILGGVMVGVLKIRHRAQEMARIARENMTCTRLCAAQVALLRSGEVGEGQGTCDHSQAYNWTVTLEPLPEGAPKGLSAYRVLVSPPSADVSAGASAVVWLPSPVADKEVDR